MESTAVDYNPAVKHLVHRVTIVACPAILQTAEKYAVSSWARILVLLVFTLVMLFVAITSDANDEPKQIQLTPEEFATEVCTQLKDKGLISIKYNGVKYDCEEYAK